MYTLPAKRWVHHIHVPSRHDMVLRLEHLVHNERFWPIVVLLAVIAMIIILSFWAGFSAEANPDEVPIAPFTYYY